MIYILPTNTCFGIACPISEIENYEKIYEIKKRNKSKAIAIMVLDFDYLKDNTKLNLKQIDFLKKYKNPWTILIDKDKITDKILLNRINSLSNSKIYKKIAFRLAHNFMHRSLITEKGALFLTSANISNNPEIFSTNDIKKEFGEIIKQENLKILAHGKYYIDYKQKYSDIFEFEGNNEDIKYIRK